MESSFRDMLHLGALLALLAVVYSCSVWHNRAKCSERTCAELSREKQQPQVELEGARSQAGEKDEVLKQQADRTAGFDAILRDPREERDDEIRALQVQLAAQKKRCALLDQDLSRKNRALRRTEALPSPATPSTAGRAGGGVLPHRAAPHTGASHASTASTARTSTPQTPATPTTCSTVFGSTNGVHGQGGEATSSPYDQPENWPELLKQARIQLTCMAEEDDELRNEAKARQEELDRAQAELAASKGQCEALRAQLTEAQRQHEAAAAATALQHNAAAAAALQHTEAEVAATRAAATRAARQAELAAAAQCETLRGSLAGALAELRVARELKQVGRREREDAEAGWEAARRELEAAGEAVRAELQGAVACWRDAVRELEEQRAASRSEVSALEDRIAAQVEAHEARRRKMQEAAEAAREAEKTERDAKEQKLAEIMQRVLLTTEHLKVLQLEQGCTADQIKEAFRRLALVIHPDKCDRCWSVLAGEAFKRANTAKEYLLRQEVSLRRSSAASGSRGPDPWRHGAF